MAREARIFAEGSLRWAQASGTGGWATASGAPTALVGFVQAGAAFTSGRRVATVMDRGDPHHHKNQGADPPTVTFTYLQAVTANMANPATAGGASVPEVHFQLRAQDNEIAAASAQYHLFMNGVLESRGWTEGEEGNQYAETWRFLSMTGPTASGYIA